MTKYKPKILLYSPIITDPVSSWRAAGPMSKLSHKYDIKYVTGDQVSWLDLVNCDLFVAHRPFLPNHVPIMALAKELGKPIWADYDDNLFEVHPSNVVYFNYVRAEVQNSVRQCLQLADHISVSVPELTELYAPYAKKMTVIPNAWDDRFMQPIDKITSSNTISWRGSDSHKNDLLSHLNPIVEAINGTPAYNWKFIGYHAWEIPHALGQTNFGGRVNWVPGQQFWSFYKSFGIINPDLNIVPLEFTRFNKCKSNIAAIEAAMAGAPSIAPNWDVWDIPGVFKYNSPEEFKDLVIEKSKDKNSLKKAREETLDFIKSELTLDKINEKRVSIIESLLS